MAGFSPSHDVPGSSSCRIGCSQWHELGAKGDFAQAYVLAHEVGHHIQNLEGTLDQVDMAKQQAWGEA